MAKIKLCMYIYVPETLYSMPTVQTWYSTCTGTNIHVYMVLLHYLASTDVACWSHEIINEPICTFCQLALIYKVERGMNRMI